MNKDELNEKVGLLEEDLKKIKAEMGEDKPAKTFMVRFREFNHFLSTYQFLLKVLFALAVILYVQWKFDIDFFQEYRDPSTTRKLAGFYQQMGDRLMYKEQWREAEKAYKQAVELQPNNEGAVLGLAKAQIFTPLEGQKYTNGEAADIKIDALSAQFPNDGDFYYLKGINAMNRFDLKTQKDWFIESLRLHEASGAREKSYGVHIALGYACQADADFACAKENFQKALGIPPETAIAHSNLGYIRLLELDFDSAAEHLEKSRKISYHALTLTTLGEVYKFSGKNISDAMHWRREALRLLNEEVNDSEETVSGSWAFNYMPYTKDDVDVKKNLVIIYTRDQKKAFVHYLMAIDFALNNDFEAAGKEFETAAELDKENYYGDFFISNCVAVKHLLKPKPAVISWFATYGKKACYDPAVCDAVGTMF